MNSSALPGNAVACRDIYLIIEPIFTQRGTNECEIVNRVLSVLLESLSQHSSKFLNSRLNLIFPGKYGISLNNTPDTNLSILPSLQNDMRFQDALNLLGIRKNNFPLGEALLELLKCIQDKLNSEHYSTNTSHIFLIVRNLPTDMEMGDQRWRTINQMKSKLQGDFFIISIDSSKDAKDIYKYLNNFHEPIIIDSNRDLKTEISRKVRSIFPDLMLENESKKTMNRYQEGPTRSDRSGTSEVSLYRQTVQKPDKTIEGATAPTRGENPSMMTRPPSQGDDKTSFGNLSEADDPTEGTIIDSSSKLGAEKPVVTIPREKELRPKMDPPFMFGAKVTGPYHIPRNIPCQDAYAYAYLSPTSGAIAVADGLGSAAKSDVGSQTAVDAAIDSIKEALNKKTEENDFDFEKIASEAVYAARNRLEERSKELHCNLRDLGCTLIVVVYQENTVLAAQIGDGAVVIRTSEGLQILSDPGDSEYANEVTPLTSDNWGKSLRISEKISDVTALAVFSDGCQRASLIKVPTWTPYEGFFNGFFHYACAVTCINKAEEGLRNFLASEKMSESSEDDKTLVISILKSETMD